MLALPEKIETREIALRLLGKSDEQKFYAVTNDPKVANIISFLSYPLDRAVTDGWIARNQGNRDRIYGIVSVDGILMGSIGAHLTDTPQEVEIGYWLGSAFWGRGIATQALRLLLETLMQFMPDYTIFAECLPDNASSLRVLEKAGFFDTHQAGHRQGRTRLLYNPS